MLSFESYFILSLCIISSVAATNITNTTNITRTTTIEPVKPIYEPNILWSRLTNYTCSDLIPAINIFYDISLTECESRCLSFPNNSVQCTAAVWYEFIKPTGNDVPRCYLFGQSCELVIETSKPVTTSFWYHNITQDINCINYPSNWKDNYFDTCDAYELFNFCDYAYNSSTTAILTYQDTIYGFDALKVCCGCNGGLLNYDNQFLLEPKWKPTSILNIYEDYNDFICETVDIAATTSILVNDHGILEKDKFNFTQFVGICQHIHSSLKEKYKLLLSITTDNNDMINVKNIYSDFNKFNEFDCIDNLLLNNVTICNETDYNNLYPFIIDLEEDHTYINNHYIHSDTFIYHLPPTNLNIKPFCSFKLFLETVYPTKPPTKEPTFEPTFEPTVFPTTEPTTYPTQPTSNPTSDPTTYPSYEPTMEPTNIPTNEPTTEPTADPTKDPSKYPTYEPTIEPTYIPTTEPTTEPTGDPSKDPTKDPTYEPTVDPTNIPTNEPTIEPTSDPTKDPTYEPTTEPTADPTNVPTAEPTTEPTGDPTKDPTYDPTTEPTGDPTNIPTNEPTIEPTSDPTKDPSKDPTYEPTTEPTNIPTTEPTTEPTTNPTKIPSINPTVTPTQFPSKSPTFEPTIEPSINPTKTPSNNPSKAPTNNPTQAPTFEPTIEPSLNPTKSPSNNPTKFPSNNPSKFPSNNPSKFPSTNPTKAPSNNPSKFPSNNPSKSPSNNPSKSPSKNPSKSPSNNPTKFPSNIPSKSPSNNPTKFPSINPTVTPTQLPSKNPTVTPTKFPSINPSRAPSNNPTAITQVPSISPFKLRRLLNHYYSTPYFKTNVIAAFLCQTSYTESPTLSPTKYPTVEPTEYMMEITESIESTLEINESSAEDDGKLSGGAIAGIVIGIFGFCICIGVLLYFFVFKNKNKSQSHVGFISENAVPSPSIDDEKDNDQKDNDSIVGADQDHADIELATSTTGLSPAAGFGAEEKELSPSAPVSDNEEVEEKYVSEVDYSWQNKRMRTWTNAEILDWIKCMNLGAELNDGILNVIEMNGCTGEDIVELKTADDVGEAFEIVGNKGLCKRILKKMKNFKPNLNGIDTFNINLFITSKDEHLTLDEEFNKTDTITKVKTRFKIQTGIDFDVNHIHFKYKKKELLDNKTLEKYGIKNDNHLIEVQIDNVFSIHIFAQDNDLTLNQKVAKNYTIRQIKEMYKNQSGVHANVDDIQFYGKKKKLMENYKTLEQCGIVDDKHLITVTFETGGGGAEEYNGGGGDFRAP